MQPAPARSCILVEGADTKLALWIGVPSLVTFLASAYAQFLENIHSVFILSVAALRVAILPRLSEARIRR